MSSDTGTVSLADVVAVACAEAFRGDGEIFASGMGVMPMLGARLARATFEPDLLVSDGEAFFVSGDLRVGERITPVDPKSGPDAAGSSLGERQSGAEAGSSAGEPKASPGMAGDLTDAPRPDPSAPVRIEGYIPFRRVFDTLWGGRRHVMMGASQMDRFGNSNISNIGDWHQPKSQLLGVRGGPGNTINHATSFWIPRHTTRVFTAQVDMVSGLGYDRAAALSPWVREHHRLPRVVTNLAVLDFETPDHSMRLVSVHPGVTVDEVVENTGFELTIGDVIESRPPTADETEAIARLDPGGLRHREVPAP